MSTTQDESLHDACAKGQLHIVREILQKNSDIANRLNQRIGFYGETPLHVAAGGGHVDILQLLLNHGASVNAVNDGGVTPLHKAAREGHVDILQLLLSHGASVNAVNNQGNTPLHEAVCEDHVDILQLLLNHGASVNAVANSGNTPLNLVASWGPVDILQLLLNHGASVNAVNEEGDTPLHSAAYRGHVDILQLLLDHGASVDTVNNEGNTPLHHAASLGHVKCVKALLKNGANINALNEFDTTPSQSAMEYGHKEIAECLKNSDKDEAIRRLEALEKDIEEQRRVEALEKDLEEWEETWDGNLRDNREERKYIRAYSQAIQEGKAKNNRIPIILVGQGRSGKTSLMRRLLGLPFEKDQPSTVGIDVNVIELSEQSAEDPWKNREVKEFMTSESEAKKVLYKKTAEYLNRGVQSNLEEDAPGKRRKLLSQETSEIVEVESLKPVKPLLREEISEIVEVEPVIPAKPLLREDISEIISQRFTKHDQKEVLRVFVNDFAGQSIYYDTHGCFVKPHCPYVLVYDLSLEFDKPAVPKFKASDEEEEIEMNNPYLNTNLDNFTSWLKFLQGLGECQDQQFPNKSCHYTTAKGENFKRPPVLIALTHSDKVKGNDSKIDWVQKRINKVLSGGKYENVVPEFFVIDNTLEGDDGDDVRKLRRKLFDLSNGVLNQEILMPVKWLDFEVALSRKLSPDCKYIPVDEAKQEAEACGVKECDQAIKFLHRQGVVVHHSGSSKVVLDPFWLMKRFTKVISMPGKLDALSRHPLDEFRQKGILFQEYLETLEDSKLLEELMQKFNLICPCQHDGKAAFYVPSVAPTMIPGKELEASKKELNVPSLFVTFPRQLVPISLFTKLQVKLISEWETRFPNQQVTPSFYCNYSLLPLIIDGGVYDVCLIDLHEFVKVTVFPKQGGDHFKFASHLLATLKKCLDDLKSPDQLLFSMTSYDLEVKCTCCFGKEERRCSRHHEIQCHSDRCGHRHFWKLSDLQRFYNDKSPAVCRSDKRSSKVFDIKSVTIWLNTVPDAAIVELSSNFRWPNETSSEASSSGSQSTGESYRKGSMNGNKFRRLKKRGKSVDMIALKNKDDDEPTNTGTGCGLLPRKKVNLL